MDTDKIERYWRAYLATLSGNSPLRLKQYVTVQFGDCPGLADRLGVLIASGIKTATCSALWEWEAEGRALPNVGLNKVVLDGSAIPLCVIETMEVTIRPFKEVSEAFAKAEGEGDFSLEYWRDAHWRFFSRTLPKIGREPNPDMPLVCERFRVIFK